MTSSISFSLVATDRAILDELKFEGIGATDVEGAPPRFGGISEVPPPSQANFDIAGAADQAYQLLTVISTMGGVIQFSAWMLGKVAAARREARPLAMMVKRGAQTSVISTALTDDKNRAALERVFGPG